MVFVTDLFSLPRLEEDSSEGGLGRGVFSAGDGTRREESAAALTRCQVIDRIMRVNSTASELFLSQFGDDQLRSYLDHLTVASGRRGREARWERRGDTPAIVGGACAW